MDRRGPKKAKPAKRLVTFAEAVEVYAEGLEHKARFWKRVLRHEERLRLKEIDNLIHILKAGHVLDARSMARLEKLREEKEQNNRRLRRARASIREWHDVEKSIKVIMKREREQGQAEIERLRYLQRRQKRRAAAAEKKRAGSASDSGRSSTVQKT